MIFSFVFPISRKECKDKDIDTKLEQTTKRVQFKYIIPTLLGSNFGVLGHLWSQNDVITSWLNKMLH